MRNRFDVQLIELNQKLTIMGALCENAISMAVKAYLEGDTQSYQNAIKLEDEIDASEKEIERLCMKLLLQQQPIATDLRVISSALKMITDLERIGDQASDIADLSRYTSDVRDNDDVKVMAKETCSMVTRAINSFVYRDLEMAKAVIDYDDVVDELFVKVKKDVVDALKKDHEHSEALLDMLMIAKYLERIGDHATNIAEWVEFSITGDHKEG